ncbi:type II toxin-antitoxin system VapC family toxin [Haloechinothrix halophila]|uniref:type II toxin-antitoxin system VapC family toxin n=1 Tax=Haloechinothrix halophila TaxID=1069073 RepID=UPI00041588BC|nr:type II toxin-antitoxin system VapC family toxin [Haloechinothrix halophila]
MTVYLETSAAAKLLVTEHESAALSAHLDRLATEEVDIVSSVLLETELRRLAVRLDLDQSRVSDVLDRIDLYEPDRAAFVEAGLLPGKHLRSLDALHVAVAIRVAADEMATYDVRQAEAARSVGLAVVAPAD